MLGFMLRVRVTGHGRIRVRVSIRIRVRVYIRNEVLGYTQLPVILPMSRV